MGSDREPDAALTATHTRREVHFLDYDVEIRKLICSWNANRLHIVEVLILSVW